MIRVQITKNYTSKIVTCEKSKHQRIQMYQRRTNRDHKESTFKELRNLGRLTKRKHTTL